MFTIAQILEATGGALLQGAAAGKVRGVSTDTRTIRRGDLFVAVRGLRFDAHDFLQQAADSGASVFLVSRKDVLFPPGSTVIFTPDTVQAYGFLARCHRRRFPDLPLVAVTGSAGKTSTKEMIAAVLKKRYRVLYNRGTENNHMGVPATLLRLKAGFGAAVIETGTNHPGEIEWLASLVEPTIAVFTNVGASHLAGLSSPEGVFEEKAALARHVPANGALVVNTDDRYFRRLSENAVLRAGRTVVTYGIERPADWQAEDIQAGVRGVSYRVRGNRYELKTPGAGQICNALAATACGRLLDVPADDIQLALKRFRSPRGRQVFHRFRGVTLIDDTYNANPVSFDNALTTLGILGRGHSRADGRSPARRMVLVAADMLELGEFSRALHREAGRRAAESGVDILLTCGEMAALTAQGARDTGRSIEVITCRDRDEVVARLKGLVRRRDTVLVKGSRGMKMELVVEAMTAFLKG